MFCVIQHSSQAMSCKMQDGAREDGRIVGEEGWQEKVH